MMLIDSHAHLDFEDYDNDFEQVLARAREAGVKAVLSVCCLEPGNNGGKLVALLQRNSKAEVELYSAFGLHPHNAVDWNPGLRERLIELCGLPSTVAVGEAGLDYYYNFSPAETQKKVFVRQIELAGDLDLPIIVHSRDAEEETLEILEDCSRSGILKRGGVLHCFTGSRKTAARLLDIGFYLSFGGILTFAKADEIREVVREMPLDRILVETDSPYLAPVPFRGKRNEPAYVGLVAEKVASLRELPVEEVARLTSENFGRLFRLRGNAGLENEEE